MDPGEREARLGRCESDVQRFMAVVIGATCGTGVPSPDARGIIDWEDTTTFPFHEQQRLDHFHPLSIMFMYFYWVF